MVDIPISTKIDFGLTEPLQERAARLDHSPLAKGARGLLAQWLERI
jgi:hypothetical protein